VALKDEQEEYNLSRFTNETGDRNCALNAIQKDQRNRCLLIKTSSKALFHSWSNGKAKQLRL